MYFMYFIYIGVSIGIRLYKFGKGVFVLKYLLFSDCL